MRPGDTVDAVIITTWTVANRWPFRGLEFTMIQFEDGTRATRPRILGAPGEDITVKVEESDLT